jgi:uncharacterized glyoxalase superfamily protein PhnB
MTESQHIPDGWPALIPRIVVDAPEPLVAFIKHVFGATGSFQRKRPSELRIGDSMLMVSASIDREPMPAFLYIYVADTDSTYRRALESGATSLESPRDLAYGDRRAMVGDAWGNIWQIATHGGRFNP